MSTPPPKLKTPKKPYAINDILYTKDGRKSGNCVIVDKQEIAFWPDSPELTHTQYTLVSDYGNLVKSFLSDPAFGKQFHKTPGKATPTHKHYNYKERFPEMFI